MAAHVISRELGYDGLVQSITQTAAITSFHDAYDAVAPDFAALNSLIPCELTSDVDMVEQIGRYIVESGGKRLRPLIVLLSARACGFLGDAHIKLAAIIEFLHTATLLHDDVVDRSDLRRGRATANALWGNAPSVLVGDFLYSRAFQMMVQIGNAEVMRILADATNVIAEGEVLQLAHIGDADTTEAQYMNVIRSKTAMLFEASSHVGAAIASDDPHTVQALRAYGLHLGLAYQLIDDYLDYAGDSATMGKNVGDDLAEGKVTLPLIHTIKHGSADDARLVREALTERKAGCLDSVCGAVRRSGALDYTYAAAARETDNALAALGTVPAGAYRDALEGVATLAAARRT